MRARVIAAIGLALAAREARAAEASAAAASPSVSAAPSLPANTSTNTSTKTATAAAPTTSAAASVDAPPSTRPTAATPGAAPSTAPPLPVLTTKPQKGTLREAAPRPATDVRVQSRFAVKAKTAQLFAAAEYLSRGDFYNSPGARIGATFYPIEPLGVELQVSHYWSSLNAEAEKVKTELGAIPDSHAPQWLILAGGRYSIGYGKFMIGGLGGAIHFEPQAFVHAGLHANDGDAGPSGDAGLGMLVFLTPKLFARLDAAVVYDREDRSGKSVSVWGTLPSLGLGGTL